MLHVVSYGQFCTVLKKAKTTDKRKLPEWFESDKFWSLSGWIAAFLETRIKHFYFSQQAKLNILANPTDQRDVLLAKWANMSEEERVHVINHILNQILTFPDFLFQE